jgi:uncharacterized protein involved in oxidation of intracellular sulfur
MTHLVILNDHPYRSERTYNGLRLATALANNEHNTVRLFLIGDGVFSAVSGQTALEGKHDIEWMLKRFTAGHREAGVCRTCMETRDIAEEALIEGTHRSTLAELAAWTKAARQVLVF